MCHIILNKTILNKSKAPFPAASPEQTTRPDECPLGPRAGDGQQDRDTQRERSWRGASGEGERARLLGGAPGGASWRDKQTIRALAWRGRGAQRREPSGPMQGEEHSQTPEGPLCQDTALDRRGESAEGAGLGSKRLCHKGASRGAETV